MADSYKSLKEDFVSNLTGGKISEINYVTAVAPSALIFWSALQSRQSFFVRQTPLVYAVDFLLNVGAILLAITLYSSNPILLNTLLLSPAALVYALLPHKSRTKRVRPPVSSADAESADKMDDLPMKPFLTMYRGSMMVVTCIAILAVDFKIFPRRFAKVENWGTSVMDVGVGSFVFSAGLVAARSVLKEQLTGKARSLAARLDTSMRHSLPLFILGFVRLYSVKGLDYAEHVTEYGVHWNFFFTLALLPPYVAVFQSAFHFVPSFAALAILLSTTYQIALEATSLKAYILSAPRTDLLSKNREGVFSFFGYLAIFLAGQATGMFVIPQQPTSKGFSRSFAQRRHLLGTLLIWSIVWSIFYLLATDYTFGFGLAVSRRLANLPYFLWIAAFNCFQITAFCAIETIFFPEFYQATMGKDQKKRYEFATSKVLAAFNRNGLAVFLIANLLTGLVNLSIPTLHLGNVEAIGILVSYGAIVTGSAVALDAYDISIKL